MNIINYDMFVGLVHHPIRDKKGDIVTTAVTNFDVHDIARLVTTFGFKGYSIVTPISEQQALVNRIVEHWVTGRGSNRNEKRTQAIKSIVVNSSIEDAVSFIQEKTKKKVKLVTTSAKIRDNSVNFSKFIDAVDDKFSYFFLFGTGWGLTDEIVQNSDYLLEPLVYETGYNHLPVRSAVSIIMDRLYNEFGRRE